MRKSILTAFLILLLTALLAGCAAPVAPATTTGEASTEAAAAAQGSNAGLTLSYLLSQGWLMEPERALAQRFQEETGITIDFQVVPADQYFTLLSTRLNSGEGPDIFGGQSGVTDLKINYNIAENGVDLSDQEWVSRADPLALAQTAVDGRQYGLTIWTPGKWPVVYNKQVFEAHGLVPPTDFEELKTICTTLLDAGVYPIYEPIADGWHHVLWFPEIGPRFEEVTPGLKDALNANEATFAENATMLEAVTDMKELYDMGCFGPNTLSDSGSETELKLASGEYAMVLSPIGQPAAFARAAEEAGIEGITEEDFGFFPNPLADNQIQGIQPAGPSKFIYSKSPNIDAAKRYFEFLTRPENLQYFYDNEPTFAELNWPGYDSKLTETQKAYLDSTPQGTVYQVEVNYVNPQWMDIGADLTAMFTGAATPEDVLANIDQRRAEMAAAANDPAWEE